MVIIAIIVPNNINKAIFILATSSIHHAPVSKIALPDKNIYTGKLIATKGTPNELSLTLGNTQQARISNRIGNTYKIDDIRNF
ncbi:hypothetical protein DM558_10280 [Entomomonas moraniae]|uniref:Uncharacterized protein n=1 Tax=Entomomonas moraniae TaxID=2213226 RepID=A0A3Q9JJN9_9GAMM|nr:hypothetical protein DM558_10280 [Entomomonas moraniae]